jgi:hypothetical protein
VFEHQSYAEIFNGTPSPVLHFWSLAIEEQFYVVFPLLAALLLWVGRGRRRVFGAALAALTVASVVTATMLSGTSASDVTRVYYGTDTRAAELLVGALLAVVLIGRRRPARGPARVTLGIAGSVAGIAMLFLWSQADRGDLWLYRGGLALHAVVVAAVLAEALLPGPLSSVLSVPPLRFLGRISYGVYLYHWPVFLWLSPERLPDLTAAQVVLLRTLVTLGLAIVSFHVLERPVRMARRSYRWWPRVVAPVAVIAIIGGAAAVNSPVPETAKLTFAPIAKGAPPHVDGARANAPGAAVGAPAAAAVSRRRAAARRPTTSTVPRLHRELESARPIRVMVVGDSVGQTLGRGFELWGIHTGRAQVWNDAHYYCSLARFAPRVYGVGEDNNAEICDSWGERWPQQLQQFDPDVVVVVYTLWEMVARKPPGAPGYLAPGDKTFDAWQLDEYTTAADVLSARGAKVVWLTLPCTEGDQPEHTKMKRYLSEHQIGGVAKRRPDAVRVLDLNREVCPAGQFSMSYAGIESARPDGAHFSDEGAEAVADWVMKQVLAT